MDYRNYVQWNDSQSMAHCRHYLGTVFFYLFQQKRIEKCKPILGRNEMQIASIIAEE